MSVTLANGPLYLAFLLALVRAGAWVSLSPPFSNVPMPTMVKVGVAVSLALMAAPHIPASQIPQGMDGMIGAIVLNVVVGSLLGLITLTLFSAILTAGALADMFGGIVLPPSLDPLSQNQVPQVGQFYNLIGLALLFVSGGYELLVAGWVKSFSGAGISLSSLKPIASVLTGDLATFFVAALEIAAPVVVVLFAAQVVMGMIAKAAPQANVFLLAFPFQVGLTLLLVGFGIEVLPASATNLIQKAVHDGLSLVGV